MKAALCFVALTACDLASGLSDFQIKGDEAASTSSAESASSSGSGASAPVAPCAILAPRDDFEDGMLAPLWTASIPDGASIVVEQGGKLQIQVATGSGDRFVDVSTIQAYDLSGCGSTARVSGTGVAGEMAYFVLTNAGGLNYAGIIYTGGELRFYGVKNGVHEEYGRAPYDAMAHALWWLRVAGEELEWYTSADGVSWQMQRRTLNFLDATTLHVTLGAGVDMTYVTAGFTALFDDVNVVP